MNAEKPVVALVSSLEIGHPALAGNLALFPLLLKTPAATARPAPYLLYEHAQSMGMVSIEEHGEGGVVSELVVHNMAAQPVLIVEGEVLLGMKQTRVLNITVLVPADSRLVVPVSCVEAGRWQSVSVKATGKAAVNLAPSVRAAKTVSVARSVRSTRSFASDQHAVWQHVDRVLDAHDMPAPSRSYAAMAGEGAPQLMELARSVRPAPGQVGVVACVGREVACVDAFETPAVLAGLWNGLVASYQADALIADTAALPLGPRGHACVSRWFRSIASGSSSEAPEVGLGRHLNLIAPGLEAAALVHDGHVVHLSAFPARATTRPTTFVSPRRRRGR
jgi:hypothetical protein